MGLFNSIFPVSEAMGWIVAAYSILLGVFVTYKFANWIYRHTPEVLGIGPGGGG
jgi:hypothetical protein